MYKKVLYLAKTFRFFLHGWILKSKPYLGLLVGIQGMCHSNRGKKSFTVAEVNLSERHSERGEESPLM